MQLSFIDVFFPICTKIYVCFHLLCVAVDCVNVCEINTETDASGVYDCQIVYMKGEKKEQIADFFALNGLIRLFSLT